MKASSPNNVYLIKLRMPQKKSATPGIIKQEKLIPTENIMQPLRVDYAAMANMFYGTAPAFDEILKYLTELETEIHSIE